MDDSVFFSLESSIIWKNICYVPLKDPFEEEFHQACVSGNVEQIKAVLDKFSAHGTISTLSHVLFDVIDCGHEDIAIYLIQEGCNTNIYKQYDLCSPDNKLCVLCPSTSLVERARMRQLYRVVNFIQQRQLQQHQQQHQQQLKQQKLQQQQLQQRQLQQQQLIVDPIRRA